MAFDKKTWANNQAGGTPLDASGLNDLESRIDDGIDELDVDLASHKAESALDDVHGLGELLQKFRIVAQGEGSDTVMDTVLSPYGIYLLGIGRDHGLYFVTCSATEITTSPIISPLQNITISTNGLSLMLSFGTRNRSFALVSLFERD